MDVLTVRVTPVFIVTATGEEIVPDVAGVPPDQVPPVVQSPVVAAVWANTPVTVINKNAKSSTNVLITFLAEKPFDDKLFITLLLLFEETFFILSV